MLNDRPVFALCTARIHNPEILESVEAFVDEAKRRGYSVIIFNSCLDRLQDVQTTDQSCYSVYDLIPFQIIDLVVVMSAAIGNRVAVATIAQIAKEHRIPMMCYDSMAEECPSVFSETCKAFPSLLDHIFGDHRCKHVDLLTGVRGNYGSESMVMAYQEALHKYGLPFDNDCVGYGDYWEAPAKEAVERFLSAGTPDAIVCVNDEMAIAACAVLRTHGLRVPEDVIVTGSDGIMKERLHTPRLTTCVKDYTQLSAAALDTAELILDGEDVGKEIEIPAILQISESCGCCITEQRDLNSAIRDLDFKIQLCVNQEADAHRLLGAVMNRKQPTVIDYLDVMSSQMPEDSYLCLRDCISPDVSESSLWQFADPGELMSTVMQRRREKQFSIISRGKLIPDLEATLGAGRTVLVSSVYFQDEVYGYYAYYGTDLEDECFKMPKFIHTIGNTIGSSLATSRLRAVNEKLLAARIRDSLTGMLNLPGVMKVLAEKIAAERNGGETLTMVIIGLNRLRQINSIFGRAEGDQALLNVAGAITDSIDSDIIAARIGGDEFMIAFLSSQVHITAADALVSVLKRRLQSYNQVSGKSYTLEVSVGKTTLPINDSLSLDNMLNETITLKDAERLAGLENEAVPSCSEIEEAQMDRILSENLLTYYFQPIVNTKNGKIFAYEALMRTSSGFRIPPLSLLGYAANNGRLYEVEWLTYNNVLKTVRQNIEKFRNKRIFINSIPGHFLNDADFERLREQYADILPQMVVEFTEQAETDGEELRRIQNRCLVNQMDIAVDDYGTGYSNITNLLRYSPNYVKIDRSLISNIHDEPKKQHFVTNIIEFAHKNGFMALAEGVETPDELRAVIRFGADLIQGNFTSMPNAIPLESIPDRISAMITKYSANAANQLMQKTYMPAQTEHSINLPLLEMEHYTDLFVAQPNLEIVGDFNETTGIHIKVKDNTDAHIIIRNIHFQASSQGPAILLGKHCNVTLEIQGDNRMDVGGILVPETSTLHLTGTGNLSIRADDTKAFAIGNSPDYSCGEVNIDFAGCLNIISNGNQCIGIGAGIGKGQRLSVCGTKLFVEMSGKDGVCIGAIDGDTEIELSGCAADFSLRMGKSVAIGSCDGCPEILCTTCDLNFRGSGTSINCIGSVIGGGDFTLKDTALNAELTGQSLFVVGSGDRAPSISVKQCNAVIKAEGTRAMDFGSFDNDAVLTVIDTDLDVSIQSVRAHHFAADKAHMIIAGGKHDVAINK